MAKKDKGEWKRVDVVWIDSTSFSNPWWTFKEFLAHVKVNKNAIVRTAGYKFYEDKKWIYLAGSLDFDGDGEILHFGGVFAIPKGCIISVRNI